MIMPFSASITPKLLQSMFLLIIKLKFKNKSKYIYTNRIFDGTKHKKSNCTLFFTELDRRTKYRWHWIFHVDRATYNSITKFSGKIE